jgi:hypothetical protein
MRPIATLVVLLLLFQYSTCWGQTSDLAGKATPQDRLSESGQLAEAIRVRLNQRIDLEFKETPWSEVETFLEKSLDCNIVLTSSAADDSLGKDEPISCSLTNMPAKSALRIMLESKNATFLLQDNVVKIISLDDAEDAKYFTNHFINVRTLLANISQLEKNRIGNARIIQKKPVGGVAAVGPSSSPEKSTGNVTAESMLIDVIQASVYPDHWQDSGQGLATIKIIGGYAVVNSEGSLADSLRDFLQDLSFHLSQE